MNVRPKHIIIVTLLRFVIFLDYISIPIHCLCPRNHLNRKSLHHNHHSNHRNNLRCCWKNEVSLWRIHLILWCASLKMMHLYDSKKKAIYPLPSRCGETWCIYICRTESIVWPFRRGIVNATVFCPIKIVINPWLGRCGDVRMVMFLTPGLKMKKGILLLVISHSYRSIKTEPK